MWLRSRRTLESCARSSAASRSARGWRWRPRCVTRARREARRRASGVRRRGARPPARAARGDGRDGCTRQPHGDGGISALFPLIERMPPALHERPARCSRRTIRRASRRRRASWRRAHSRSRAVTTSRRSAPPRCLSPASIRRIRPRSRRVYRAHLRACTVRDTPDFAAAINELLVRARRRARCRACPSGDRAACDAARAIGRRR